MFLAGTGWTPISSGSAPCVWNARLIVGKKFYFKAQTPVFFRHLLPKWGRNTFFCREQALKQRS